LAGGEKQFAAAEPVADTDRMMVPTGRMSVTAVVAPNLAAGYTMMMEKMTVDLAASAIGWRLKQSVQSCIALSAH
jgi:hypothetical protein